MWPNGHSPFTTEIKNTAQPGSGITKTSTCMHVHTHRQTNEAVALVPFDWMESAYWSGEEARTSVWFGEMPLRWTRNDVDIRTTNLYSLLPQNKPAELSALKLFLLHVWFFSMTSSSFFSLLSLCWLSFVPYSPILCPAKGFTWKWLYSRGQWPAAGCVPSFLSRATCGVWQANWE